MPESVEGMPDSVISIVGSLCDDKLRLLVEVLNSINVALGREDYRAALDSSEVLPRLNYFVESEWITELDLLVVFEWLGISYRSEGKDWRLLPYDAKDVAARSVRAGNRIRDIKARLSRR